MVRTRYELLVGVIAYFAVGFCVAITRGTAEPGMAKEDGVKQTDSYVFDLFSAFLLWPVVIAVFTVFAAGQVGERLAKRRESKDGLREDGNG